MADPQTIKEALEQIDLLNAQNRRLRSLLDNADAPGELRHRLRSTLSLVRALMHGSAKNRQSIDDYVAHLDDRLDAVIRAQAMADATGAVDLRELIVEQMHFYQAIEGEKFALDGEDVAMQPRIGQAMALAIHELAVNSVEFGSLGGTGRVDVQWQTTQDWLSCTWRETGAAIQPAKNSGFGSEYILQAMPYQFNAETSLTIETGLVLCTIRLPLAA